MLDIERNSKYTKHVQDYFLFQEYRIFCRNPAGLERILCLFKKYCTFWSNWWPLKRRLHSERNSEFCKWKFAAFPEHNATFFVAALCSWKMIPVYRDCLLHIKCTVRLQGMIFQCLRLHLYSVCPLGSHPIPPKQKGSRKTKNAHQKKRLQTPRRGEATDTWVLFCVLFSFFGFFKHYWAHRGNEFQRWGGRWFR